jgi:O-6-methylguanine DNA methyltransferase
VTGDSSLGIVAVVRSAEGICAIHFGMNGDEIERDLANWFPARQLVVDTAGLREDLAEVIACVDWPRRGLKLSLDMKHGTDLQREVWGIVHAVRCGEKISVDGIARRLCTPQTNEAVVKALAASTIAIGIPSHRVVDGDGAAVRFRWGEWCQRVLLAREILF